MAKESNMETQFTDHRINSDKLASVMFSLAAVLFAGFIAWASFYGADISASTPERVNFSWEHLTSWYKIDSYRAFIDISSNILLYMPLGIFVALAVSMKRARFLTFWLVLGFFFSLSVEFIQKFIGRNSDSVDVLMNTGGYLLGYVITIFAVKFLGFKPAMLLGMKGSGRKKDRINTIAGLRFVYVCFFLVIALIPFDISVDARRIFAQLSDRVSPQLILDPFHHIRHWPADYSRLFLLFLGYMPLALLSSYINRLKNQAYIMKPVLGCIILAFFSESMKIFVLSRTTDIAALPLAVFAGITGWVMVKTWFHVDGKDNKDFGAYSAAKKYQMLVFLIFYACVICLFAWSPYQFELDAKFVIEKIRTEGNWIPFARHFSYRSLGNALDLVKEAGIFIPFGILLASFLDLISHGAARWIMVVWVGMLSFCFSFSVELSQGICIGRYVDITDVIMATIGGIAGVVLSDLFKVRGT